MRYTFDDLKAQIIARLPDNSTGQITPAVLRGVLLDFVDSVAGAYVSMTRTDTKLVNIDTTLAPIPLLFAELVESAPLEVSGDLASQGVTNHVGHAFEFVLSVVCSGPADTRITIGLTIDGLEYELFQTQGILPAGDAPLTLTSSGYVLLDPAQAVHCALKVDGAATDVTVGPASMLVRLIPSRT